MGEGGQNTTTKSTHHEPLLLLGLLGGVVQQQVSSPAGLQCQQVQTLATGHYTYHIPYTDEKFLQST